MTDDLITFLRARLDEDEATATTVRSSWRQVGETGVIVASDGGYAEECANGNWAGIAEHITRHDPARVLAEVDAKQKLVALHSKTRAWVDGSAGTTAGYAGAVAADMLHLLALPYADHPNYRDEWRPS